MSQHPRHRARVLLFLSRLSSTTPLLREATRRGAPDLAELQDRATLEAIAQQEQAGVDVVSDGEQRRDNFYSFVAERQIGNVAQMLLCVHLVSKVQKSR